MGTLFFSITEDCDYNSCTQSEGEIIFKKKRSGGYYLELDLFTAIWDWEDGPEDGDWEAWCKRQYPKGIAKGITMDDDWSPTCTADVNIILGKQ